VSNRTTIEFHSGSEIWPVVDKWAGENGCKLKESGDNERLYQKESGILMMVPLMLKVRREQQTTILEAWLRVNLFARFLSRGVSLPEMGIQSGSLAPGVPRIIARKAVNKLLAQLGQPGIP
jgi:hypothetical protein